MILIEQRGDAFYLYVDGKLIRMAATEKELKKTIEKLKNGIHV